MNSQSQTYYFWQLADFLIESCNYRLVRINEQQNEIWLENPKNKQSRIIRIVRADIDWGNRVKRDIEILHVHTEKLRKRLGVRELHIVNMYITEHLPVDDTSFLNVVEEKKKVHIQSYLIDRQNRNENIKLLGGVIGQEMHIPEIEQEEIVDIQLLQKKIIIQAQHQAKEEKELFNHSKPLFTYIFMVIQVVIFLLMELSGGSTNNDVLLRFGAKFNPAILEGEWWRFFTPIFLHIGTLHIVMNTLSLYYIGTAIERMYGKVRFLLIYLFAGFTGTVASFIFSDNLSAGASGAIFGCFGALLYMGVSKPAIFFRTIGTNVLVLIGINILFGFSVSGIDNAGHIGGLIGGFLMTAIVYFPKKKNILIQLLAFIVTIGLTIGSLIYGFNFERATTINYQLQQLIDEKEYEEAAELAKSFVSKGKGDAITYFQYSLAELFLENYDEAIPLLKKSIELEPNLHEAHFNLALVYGQKGEVELAKEHVEMANDIMPSEKYEELLQQLE